MEELRRVLRSFIQENFLFGRSDGLLPDTDSLVDSGVIDSTGVLLLVSFLEERFGLDVKDDEIVPSNLDSIDNLAKYIARKLGPSLPQEGPSSFEPIHAGSSR